MTLIRKVAYNVIISAVSKVLSTVLALISIGFITRHLGKEGFGEYTTALAFFALFVALADLGLNTLSTREISKKGADEVRIMGNVFGLRLVISGAMVVISSFLIFFLPYSQDIKIGILFSLLAFFFSSSYTIFNGIFQKNLAMDRVALVEFLAKILQTGLIITFVLLDFGIFAILSAFVIFMVFNFVVLFFWSRTFIQFIPRFEFVFWKKFLRQSLPLGISVIITFFYFKFDTILLSFLQGAEAVGVFGAAYKIIENVTFFPAMIMGLTLPLLSQKIDTEKESFRRIANVSARVFFLLVIPMTFGGFLLARDIILLVGGEDFLASVLVLQVLLFALAFMFFGHFFNTLLIVGNRQKLLMKLLAFCAVFNIILNLIVIPQYSYLGAAITSALTEFLVVVLTGWSVWKTLGYTISLHRIGKIMLSGIFMAVVIFLLSSHVHFFISLFVGMIVYGVSIFFTRAVEPREWRDIFFRSKDVPNTSVVE
jgi:O-antigen/teichoic acid export membrane protein